MLTPVTNAQPPFGFRPATAADMAAAAAKAYADEAAAAHAARSTLVDAEVVRSEGLDAATALLLLS